MESFRSRLELITCLALFVVFMPRPALAQTTTLNLSQDLVNLGIASMNMVPNQPTLDAGPLLQSGVAYANSHSIATVIANPGAYYFLTVVSNTHVTLSGINNMTIDFHGSDLIFTHPLYYGIIVYYSTGAVLQNFTTDYQPLPFTQVSVSAVDIPNSQIQYALLPGWPDPSTFNSVQGPAGSPQPSMDVHIFRNGQLAPGIRRTSTQLPITGGKFPLIYGAFGYSGPPAPAVRPGDIAVVAFRSFANPVATNHCNGCTLRNITIYSAPSGAAQTLDTQSSLMERVYSIPKPGTDRLVSTYGFGVQMIGPNNKIRLSRAVRTMDDGFTFAGESIGTVQNQIDSRNVTVAATGGPTLIGAGDPIPNGSPVSFQRLSDGVILGSAIITSQTPPSSSPLQITFTLDRDLPGNLVGAVMYTTDPNQNGANSAMERSTVQDTTFCCKGVYVAGLANSAISGNYFFRTAYSAIFMLQSMAPGDPPTAPPLNLNVANNVVDGADVRSDWWWFEFGGIQTVTLTTRYDLMATSPLSNINVTNNFIGDPGRSAVWIGNTSGGSVTGNYLWDPNDRPDLANAYPGRSTGPLLPLVIDTTSSGITTANNTIDQVSGRMFVTDTLYRELAAYAPGGTIRLNAYNLGTLANLTVTLTDADGVTTGVLISNMTTHAIDIKLPLAAGLGGAYLKATSGNANSFGTLFIDSQDNIPAVNGCTYEVSMSSTSVSANGGNLPILVVTQSGCSYQVLDSDSFVTPGAPGTGTGLLSVGFALDPGAARTTTIEIAGQPITVTQAGLKKRRGQITSQ